jgi:hypothetical protein
MADRDYIKQKAEDRTSAEALKHCSVNGETVAGNTATAWIYPGNARSVIWVSTYAVKAELRGAGGDGLGTTTYRLYAPTAGAVASTTANAGCIFGNALPHEFRLENQTGSADCKITWYINY